MDEPAEAEIAADSLEAPPSPGERLRRAREANGKSLQQVAAETRIPQRHLQLIEAGEFARLPARTYAIGFSTSFAKAVGLDGEEIAEEVRAELARLDPAPVSRASFEPGDPARVPGSTIIWIASAAVLALLVVGYFSYNSLFAPAAELPSLLPEEQPAAQAVPSAAPVVRPAASGPVVFTALAPRVWVKFYDANGTQLMQKEMALGETYTVPANAQGPQLWTGRPDALKITVGGRAVPPLAIEQTIVKDVPVTAAALLARKAPAPTPAATPTPTPAQARTSVPTPVPAAATRPAPSPTARAQNPNAGPVANAIEAAGRTAPTD
jgi:cytoskeletal protein RodZ